MSAAGPGYESAAVLTIKNADLMTVQGRRDVADWLRKQAISLIKQGPNYSRRFRARYLYPKAGAKHANK